MLLKKVKRLVLVCVVLTIFNCKSTKIDNETQIIESYINNVLLNKPTTLTKRYYNEGVRLKDIEDKQWFVDNYSRKPLNPKSFSPQLSDSLFKFLFHKQAIDSYNKQLLNKNLNLEEIDQIKTKIKIRPYSIEPREKFKYNRYAIDNISIPLFSLDGNYAILYHTTSHVAILYIFKKDEKEWRYYSTYNLSFPEIYKNRQHK